MPKEYIGRIKSVSLRDTCARFYPEVNCAINNKNSGFKLLERYSSFDIANPWDFDGIRSIGPCPTEDEGRNSKDSEGHVKLTRKSSNDNQIPAQITYFYQTGFRGR